jgi:N-acyl-D-amino-acid deacylase
MADFDIHIRNGTIVDGTRMPRYRGDIWIKDGVIAQIGGRPRGDAAQAIDAEGLVVAPGFVDLHTHYDAQIRWDPWCTISGWHGVTSVALGNCGFGFAPVKPDGRERSLQIMTRTEAIPLASMQQGMAWDWETIPEYLDSLERAPKGVNCLQYMPTASLMIYVMGLEAAKSRPATKAEKAEMKRLLHEGMDAGLCGFSIQRLGPQSTQADYDGTPMVTDIMADEDILNLAEVLAERDEGVIQITQATNDPGHDLAFQEELARVARRPILHNLLVVNSTDPGQHVERLAWLDRVNDEGLRIFGQSNTVRNGFAFSFDEWNLYDGMDVWNHALTGSLDEKKAKLADPDVRAAIRAEHDQRNQRSEMLMFFAGGPLETLILQDVAGHDELEPLVGRSLGDIARDQNKHIVDAMFDLALATDLRAEFLEPMSNRGFDADEYVRIAAGSSYTMPGLSDGGAHMRFTNGGAYTTDLLMWLVRDQKKLSLEEAHYRLSALPAHAAGFRDRGTLRVGAPADVIVYDLDGLDIAPFWSGEIVHDLPAQEWRRVSHAKGYRAIIVNGVVTFEDGECTMATPGKLLRHGVG